MEIKTISARDKIIFCPGNGGTAQLGENVPIKATDIQALLFFAKQKHINLTVVGPDDPLALGIVDEFQKYNLNVFGPTKKAAKLEWSKVFAKQFMSEENIPTATYRSFNTIHEAKKYIRTHSFPVVIKASGLALGKGVIIAQTKKEANKILDDIMVKKFLARREKK